MNILVPDSWLREFLITKATPKQIKEYLSLCGPSIERMHEKNSDIVYDIEITGNRPDSMSIAGVAREAAAILPRFGIEAKLFNDPYGIKIKYQSVSRRTNIKNEKKLTIDTDPLLNPRWTSVIMSNVKVGPSPEWLSKKLEATGIRSLNNIIDITNYLMRAYGQPAHVFDFDAISDKDNHATMILRSSRKGEKLVTLDGKSHILPGGDIVIEDGKGNLIDLCGIMGAQNSAIASTTKTVILFLQTYDPIGIRRTMMSLGHRTEAGGLFEKGTDPELVMPACTKGVELIQELSGGRVASRLYDYYPKPYSSAEVSVSRTKSDAYIGKHLTDKEIGDMLTPMGFEAHLTKDVIRVTVPSFRRDVAIDVDIIEELARIYGYHNITSTLPDTPPPVSVPDPALSWEEEIKVRLRDWGYTETYTYSMISEELMDIFGLDTSNAYKIANPLSNEWVYMRPQLTPSVLASLSQNIHIKNDLKLFELSMVYVFRANDLPIEIPTLVIAWTGNKFYEAKGVAEAIFDLMGIEFPSGNHKRAKSLAMNSSIYLHVGDYGSIEGINPYILSRMNIDTPVTRLFLDFSKLIKHAKTIKNYTPIPKYPPSFEDLAFNVKPKTLVGDMIASLKTVDPLISDISLLDSFGDTRTLHITYLSLEGNLVSEDIKRVREKILSKALKDFEAVLKS